MLWQCNGWVAFEVWVTPCTSIEAWFGNAFYWVEDNSVVVLVNRDAMVIMLCAVLIHGPQ